MSKVYSKALNKHSDVDRIIGHVSGKTAGPCLIFIAGIHGNEPSGIFALQQVFEALDQIEGGIKGSVYGLAGNLWALQRGERFQTKDLNRLWTTERTAALESGTFEPQNEDECQQLSIHNTIKEIMAAENGPFYFFDLHTTSSPTIPFITVNDSLLNRKFTSQYPLVSILGIEEHLNGPLLSYMNELGYVSFGFEGGQHDSLDAIENHKIFAMLSMVFAGTLNKNQVAYDDYLKQWTNLNFDYPAFYEISHRYEISENEEFLMQPGFDNFQKVKKGEVLAESNGNPIRAQKDGMLFMPLYQSKGNDGYFLLKPTSVFFLYLSGVLRKLKVDRIFPILPGINWSSRAKDTLYVDLRIARFIARPLFHLFGYRTKMVDNDYMIVRNREYRSRKRDYVNESWY